MMLLCMYSDDAVLLTLLLYADDACTAHECHQQERQHEVESRGVLHCDSRDEVPTSDISMALVGSV